MVIRILSLDSDNLSNDLITTARDFIASTQDIDNCLEHRLLIKSFNQLVWHVIPRDGGGDLFILQEIGKTLQKKLGTYDKSGEPENIHKILMLLLRQLEKLDLKWVADEAHDELNAIHDVSVTGKQLFTGLDPPDVQDKLDKVDLADWVQSQTKEFQLKNSPPELAQEKSAEETFTSVENDHPLSITNIPPSAFGDTLSNDPPPDYKLHGLSDMEGVFVSQYQHRALVDDNGRLVDPVMAIKAGSWAQEGLSIRCSKKGSCNVRGTTLHPYIESGYIRLPACSLRIKLGFDLSTDDSMKDYLEFVSEDESFKLRWYRYTIGLNPLSMLPRSLWEKMCSQLSNKVLNMWGLRGGKHIKSQFDGYICEGKNWLDGTGDAMNLLVFLDPRVRNIGILNQLEVNFWAGDDGSWIVRLVNQVDFHLSKSEKEKLVWLAPQNLPRAAPPQWTNVDCTDDLQPQDKYIGSIPSPQMLLNLQTKAQKLIEPSKLKVYAAMTTMASRLEGLVFVIDSLLKQSRPFDGIVITVPDHSFREGNAASNFSSPWMKQKPYNKIIWQKSSIDLGPATRFFGIVYYLKSIIESEQDAENTYFVTLDDDAKYLPNALADLLTTLKANPWNSISYNVAERFHTSAGTLWPQGQSVDMWLHHYPEFRTINKWPRPAHCYFVDDMWISSMHNLLGSPPKQVSKELWKGNIYERLIEVANTNGLLSTRGEMYRWIDNHQCRLALHEVFCGKSRACGTGGTGWAKKPERSWLWRNGSCSVR